MRVCSALSALVLVRARVRACALGTAAAPQLLQPGESRRVGSCLVDRRGDTLRLERVDAEPGNIQSEWRLDERRAPDYAGVMADMGLESLAGRRGGRVLMLGLGGGTIAAHMLLRAAAAAEPDWGLSITAVEYDADVSAAAQELFFPLMLDASDAAASNMARRVHIVEADAVSAVMEAAAGTDSGGRGLDDGGGGLDGPFDCIIEDFAYARHGFAGTAGPDGFWRSLRSLCAPGGVVVANTLYDEAAQMDALERDLRGAGWRDINRRVDRGLQREWPWERWGWPPGRGEAAEPSWRPRDNMIFRAVNPMG